MALNYWIRFKYLNDYMQLKEPPLQKPGGSELHPDVNTGEYFPLLKRGLGVRTL
jgi:lysophospholipid hydrolase